ncbi:glutathione peroxidase [Neopusillimonas aromaticivorans]|uniref:glutathione peroxidase n=1 Tax=Neopusillimonas aromaticivorans TaxID=2979868 RepID=UPI0025978456|nr:glutathione peroxidase [Neopusillimonas aromaticivorans]NLZ10287.1 glutathione peroxidase [Alcaligenaceae bacterium]WJJ93633.1 glutathione peroxidase [Neopusillimonas aromaticivorans]
MTTLDTFSATLLDGTLQPLDHYQGQVVLVVNVASNCGFTSQYQGLQALYEKFQARGFTVLGFPCNQFGGQEPGDANDIRQFCDTRYRITFPMFDKIDVNGVNAHPLFQWLKSSRPGVLGSEAIKWNFTKFLVGRDGRVVARYAPTTAPSDLEKDINAALEG